MAVSVRLGEKIETLLDNLSKKTGRTKSFYIKTIIEKNIEMLEDIEDLHDYEKAMKNYKKEDYRPMEEYLKENGMEDIITKNSGKTVKKASKRNPKENS